MWGWILLGLFLGSLVAICIPLERARTHAPWSDEPDRVDELLEADRRTRERNQ